MLACTHSVTAVPGTILSLVPQQDRPMSTEPKSTGPMPPEEDIRKTIVRFANSFGLKAWVVLESTLADVLTVDYSDLRVDPPAEITGHEYAQARGFEVVGEFIDHGVSGAKDSRPALDKMLAAAGIAVPSQFGGNGADKVDSLEPRKIREQVLAVLEDYPEGLPSREIADKVNTRFGRKIKSSNISWHLSHLKKDKELVLENGVWLLPIDQDELELVDPEPEKEKTNQAAE